MPACGAKSLPVRIVCCVLGDLGIWNIKGERLGKVIPGTAAIICRKLKLRIGAAKTIGDYVLIDAIPDDLRSPGHEISLMVDNTKRL